MRVRTILSPAAAFAAAAAAALLVAACIDRSNPFDPINGGTLAAAEIRQRDLPALTALLDAGKGFADYLKTEADRFASHSAANAALDGANAAMRDANLRIAAANAAVEEYNGRQTIVDSLRTKARFAYPDTLALYSLAGDFAAKRSTLLDGLRSASRHMDSVNAVRFPVIVYDAAFMNSALASFARDTLAFAGLQASVDAANAAVRSGNADMYAYKNSLEEENRAVKEYNEYIDFRKRTQNGNVIARSDSLQAATLAAKAGDTLFLGPGTFNVNLAFANSGTSTSPIVVRGYPGRGTIIRPTLGNGGSSNSLIVTNALNNIYFEGLVFRGGVESNVKLEGNASQIIFRNCLFDSSQGAGLEAYDSDMELVNCEVRANAGDGVRVGGDFLFGREIDLTNVLIAGNGGSGLHSTSQHLELENCTFANNGADGIQLISPSQSIKITNSILAWNKGYGINRQAVVDYQDALEVSRSILFGNGVNWGLDALEESSKEKLIQANPIVDPDFIDTAAYDYNPRPGSFLDAFDRQAPPNVIGYRKAAP